MKTQNPSKTTPTQLPWGWDSATGESFILSARSVRYAGWPNFGRPIVCEVKYTVSADEAEANRDLIIAAVNACFAVNRDNPLAAALAYPQVLERFNELIYAAGHLLNNWEKNLTEPVGRLNKAVSMSMPLIRDVVPTGLPREMESPP